MTGTLYGLIGGVSEKVTKVLPRDLLVAQSLLVTRDPFGRWPEKSRFKSLRGAKLAHAADSARRRDDVYGHRAC